MTSLWMCTDLIPHFTHLPTMNDAITNTYIFGMCSHKQPPPPHPSPATGVYFPLSYATGSLADHIYVRTHTAHAELLKVTHSHNALRQTRVLGADCAVKVIAKETIHL